MVCYRVKIQRPVELYIEARWMFDRCTLSVAVCVIGGGQSAKTTRRHARPAQRVFSQLAGGGRVAAGLGIAALVLGCRPLLTSEQGRPGGGRYSPDREMGSGLATCGLGRRGRARRGGSWVVKQTTALGVVSPVAVAKRRAAEDRRFEW